LTDEIGQRFKFLRFKIGPVFDNSDSLCYMIFFMPEDQLPGRILAIHDRIRRRFPQVEKDLFGHRRIHLNCAAGTLAVDTAAKAMGDAATWSNALPGEIYPAEIATKEFHERVRGITADFLNAPNPSEISFHFSTTHGLMTLAFSLRGLFNPKSNLIVTDLDHMANVSPWETVEGKLSGAEIRRARITDKGRLDLDHLLSLVDEETGLVAVTLASNGLGTIAPLEEAIPMIRAKSPSCLICVDAVHHALHGSIDVQQLGCDFLAFSGYKVFGPMLGVLWGKKGLFGKLEPYRVETNKNEAPYRYEQGTLSNAALASLEAALQYILWLAEELNAGWEADKTQRPAKFKAAMMAIASYEAEISRLILDGFERLDKNKFRCYGITDPDECLGRDPTFAFEVSGQTARQVKKYLWDHHSIQTADGNHYSAVFYRHFRRDSICRASFAHYNSLEEAQLFLAALEELVAGS
jgi:selenocysteine lyase/cysteine desulfurase